MGMVLIETATSYKLRLIIRSLEEEKVALIELQKQEPGYDRKRTNAIRFIDRSLDDLNETAKRLEALGR